MLQDQFPVEHLYILDAYNRFQFHKNTESPKDRGLYSAFFFFFHLNPWCLSKWHRLLLFHQLNNRKMVHKWTRPLQNHCTFSWHIHLSLLIEDHLKIHIHNNRRNNIHFLNLKTVVCIISLLKPEIQLKMAIFRQLIVDLWIFPPNLY